MVFPPRSQASDRRSLNMPGYVVVDGNVGSGKTTLLRNLKRMGFLVVPEPIGEWTGGPRSPLSEMYSGTPAGALSFQIHVTASMHRNFVEHVGGRADCVAVVERDPFDSGIFLSHLTGSRLLTPRQASDISYITGAMRGPVGCRGRVGSIYLRLDPRACLDRIRERGREHEGGVSLAEVESLHAAHEARYNKPTGGFVVIDASAGESEVAARAAEFISGITKEKLD